MKYCDDRIGLFRLPRAVCKKSTWEISLCNLACDKLLDDDLWDDLRCLRRYIDIRPPETWTRYNANTGRMEPHRCCDPSFYYWFYRFNIGCIDLRDDFSDEGYGSRIQVDNMKFPDDVCMDGERLFVAFNDNTTHRIEL